jgi:hypothetical protein
MNHLEQQPDVEKLGLIYNKEQMEETIHDKYRKHIEQVTSGYCRLDAGQAIEILRWCESKLGKNIPMNLSCGTCILDLMRLFIRLEK